MCSSAPAVAYRAWIPATTSGASTLTRSHSAVGEGESRAGKLGVHRTVHSNGWPRAQPRREVGRHRTRRRSTTLALNHSGHHPTRRPATNHLAPPRPAHRPAVLGGHDSHAPRIASTCPESSRRTRHGVPAPASRRHGAFPHQLPASGGNSPASERSGLRSRMPRGWRRRSTRRRRSSPSVRRTAAGRSARDRSSS